MAERKTKEQKPTAVQTTGHAWDGDLQEYNNPLPRWWLWGFYATVAFAVIYWIIYPAWPIGKTWTKGVGTVTYTVNGQEKEMRWNTRSKLLHDLHDSDAAIRQQEMMDKVAGASFEEISKNPEMLAFVRSVGKGLFGDMCAACHGSGGQGVIGLFPNLADDAWLWGGKMEEIQQTISNGRIGFMPAFGEVLTDQQLDDVAEYELTLSGEAEPSEASERGRQIFQGPIGGCYTCHGPDGKGRKSQGAANLTDKIWTLANVPGQDTVEGKKAVIKQFVSNGVPWNSRRMPTWKGRLSAIDIKLLAVYVHELGGGQ